MLFLSVLTITITIIYLGGFNSFISNDKYYSVAVDKKNLDKTATATIKNAGTSIKSTDKPTETLTISNTIQPTKTEMLTKIADRVKPNESNTGVQTNRSLKRYDGNMYIETPGAVIDSMDIYGFVTVKAKNVTIKNCIIRGGKTSTKKSLLTSTYSGVTIINTELVPKYPSVYIDGLKGYGFTAKNMKIHGTVDTVVIYGNNTSIENSYLYGNVRYPKDPAQNGGPSHDDGVQIEGGSNIKLEGNNITGAHNAAIQITQNYSLTSNITINKNWLSNGNCTVNVAEKGKGAIKGLIITNNLFGNSVLNCPVIMPPATGKIVMATNNIFEKTGKPVPIQKNATG